MNEQRDRNKKREWKDVKIKEREIRKPDLLTLLDDEKEELQFQCKKPFF